jgi:type I restriction enzyme M protein
VLGTLFYRFISENFTNYIEGGDDSIDYASMPDDVITPEIKDDAVKTKGYFIYPGQLFVNIAKTANTNPNLNTDLAAIFRASPIPPDFSKLALRTLQSNDFKYLKSIFK